MPVLTCLGSRPRGAVIFVALTLIAAMSISIVAMLRYTMYQQRVSDRRIEREAIYYTAEAGVDQVMHYLRFPGDWTDPDFFESDSGGSAKTYAELIARLNTQGGSLTLIDSNTNADLIVIETEAGSGVERSRVSELVVSLPSSPDASGEFLVVESHAMNANGVERIVRANFNADDNQSLAIPAAIISHAFSGTAGQANVHWGEGWFRDDFKVPNGGLNNLPTTGSDPWAIFHVVGNILMHNGKFADGTNNGSNSPLTEEDPNYYQPWLGDSDHENLFQHADPDSLEWPELDYETWKELAQTRGHYFSTDASGNLYAGSVQTEDNELSTQDFLSIIDQSDDVSVNTGTQGDQSLPPALIIFIDTVDGNPPADDGSNLCDISLAGGGGIFTHGVMYVGGDLRVGGAGNPPAIWMADPEEIETGTGDWELENVRHKGLIYTDGVYQQQGNQVTFGAIVCKGGFASGGTPDIWYDASLMHGLPFNSTPGVTVSHWEELDPNIGG